MGDYEDATKGATELAGHFLGHFGDLSHCAMRAMHYPGSSASEVR